jgi:hypothetical protein
MKTAMLVTVLSAVGCAPIPVSQHLHTVSRGRYELSEKRAVWGRALESFQEHNIVVTVVDYEAGVLASGGQPETVRCAGASGKCQSVTGVQFTMSDDGTALFTVRRGVSGMMDGYSAKPLIPPPVEADMCKEADETLAFIVGQAGSVKPQPEKKKAQAQQGLSQGEFCSNDGECRDGLSCTMMRCTR